MFPRFSRSGGPFHALLALQTSSSLSNQQRHELLAPLSRIVAECIGKPERYVMVTIDQTAMLMGGVEGPAAYAGSAASAA